MKNDYYYGIRKCENKKENVIWKKHSKEARASSSKPGSSCAHYLKKPSKLTGPSCGVGARLHKKSNMLHRARPHANQAVDEEACICLLRLHARRDTHWQSLLSGKQNVQCLEKSPRTNPSILNVADDSNCFMVSVTT
jgi:hypothetical protein